MGARFGTRSAEARRWDRQRGEASRAVAALRRTVGEGLALRGYQSEAIEAVRSHWAEGGTAPLVEAATGTGKSAMIAGLIRAERRRDPDLRVLMVVYVRELVAQNAAALLRVWPDAPLGINSEGLGSRDRLHSILFASIQSVRREDAYSLGRRHLVVVDEAHLISRRGDGMYRRLLGRLRQRVPDLRVAGFTATPFRMDSGRLDEGEERLFERIVYAYGPERGIADGVLSPLQLARTDASIDASAVPVRAGDFAREALAEACDQDRITRTAAEEIATHGTSRRSWLVFASSVDHALRLREAIRARGVAAETVTAGMPHRERDRILEGFRAGTVRCVTNFGVLTTGFDAPGIDLIAVLRPTLSRGLHVQMLGRGTRVAPGKTDCLVLDIAGNVARHGWIEARPAWSAPVVVSGENPPPSAGEGVDGRVDTPSPTIVRAEINTAVQPHPPGAWPLTALRQAQCRFACTPDSAGPAEHRFCGAPVERPGKPYCAAHAALCFDRRAAEVLAAQRARAAVARMAKRTPGGFR